MANRKIAFSSLLFAFFAINFLPAARAQNRVETRIVSDVELVRIPIMVFDSKGAVATNLTKNDFRLFEDGVQQKILALRMDRVPVSFVIVADVSESMTRKIPFVQDAALSILDPAQQGPRSDEYSILGVASRSKLLIPFTRDQQDIQHRLPFLLTATNGSTALFDGICLGLNVAENSAANARQAMIIITDGGDNHSRYNLRQMKTLLEEADTPIFAVMAESSFEFPFFRAPAVPTTPMGKGSKMNLPDFPFGGETQDYIGPAERRGPHNMKVLAEASGGGVFTARRSEDLPRIVQTIALAVRYRYILTYNPSRDDPFMKQAALSRGDRTLHKIHLELYPRAKFAGYSMPYYKHSYRAFH